MALAHSLLNSSPTSSCTATKLKSYGRSYSPRFISFNVCRCSASDKEDHASSSVSKELKKWDGEGMAKMAVVAIAAGVLIMGSAGDAMAAKSGGRVGGQAFRSSPPPKSAPRSSGPRIDNSRRNIYVNPPIAPPLFGGYGYGTPFFGGGWGWSPFTFFAPGPSVAIGVGGGFDFLGLLIVLGIVGTIIRSFLRRDDYDDDYYD